MAIRARRALARPSRARRVSDLLEGEVVGREVEGALRARRPVDVLLLRVDHRKLVERAGVGIVREDLVSEVINLLRLRYFLTERVFFHHTKSASGAMISKIIERALELGLKLEDILPLGDERLLTLIDLRWGEDPLIRSLLQALAARQIYKRAYVLTRRIGSLAERQLVARYHVSSASRQAAEEELCGLLNFKPGELIIYCPAAEMQLKEAEVLIKIDPQGPRSLASLKLPEVEVLREKHRNLWRFYVLVAPKRLSRLKKISQVCERYFQLENHLPVVQSSQLYLAL